MSTEYGAGAVFVDDDDGLAKAAREFLRDQAAQHVGGAARGKRHDHAYRFVRIRLCERGGASTQGEHQCA
jgi:hypothetical protein